MKFNHHQILARLVSEINLWRGNYKCFMLKMFRKRPKYNDLNS